LPIWSTPTGQFFNLLEFVHDGSLRCGTSLLKPGTIPRAKVSHPTHGTHDIVHACTHCLCSWAVFVPVGCLGVKCRCVCCPRRDGPHKRWQWDAKEIQTDATDQVRSSTSPPHRGAVRCKEQRCCERQILRSVPLHAWHNGGRRF